MVFIGTWRCWLACFLVWNVSSGLTAAEVLIAGSGGSPPALQDSFTGLSPDLEVASAFVTESGAPSTLAQLQIAAYHYADVEGDSATFRIYSDVAGGPGVELVSFAADNLPGISAVEPPSTAPITNLTPSAAVILQPSTKYWLAASTTDTQVNWVHGFNALSQGATRSNGGAWTVDSADNGNEPAFALYASTVPEPSTALLAVVGMLGVTRRQCWR